MRSRPSVRPDTRRWRKRARERRCIGKPPEKFKSRSRRLNIKVFAAKLRK